DAPGVAMITSGNGIRIKIPTGVNMIWDTTVNSVQTFTDLNVTPHSRVSGLRFSGFGAPSTGVLSLEIDGDAATEDDDSGTKAIGQPALTYAATDYNQ